MFVIGLIVGLVIGLLAGGLLMVFVIAASVTRRIVEKEESHPEGPESR